MPGASHPTLQTRDAPSEGLWVEEAVPQNGWQ